MWKTVAVLVAIMMQVLAAEDKAVDVKKLQQQISIIEQQLTSQNQQLVQHLQNMQQQWLAEKRELKEEINNHKEEINKLTQHIEELEEGNNQFMNKAENLFGKVTHDNQNLRHLVEKSMIQHNNAFVAFSAYATEDRPYDDGAIVQFDSVSTNEGGFYSDLTSTFLCVYPGFYLFSVNVRTASGYGMNADIEIGGDTVASVWAASDHDAASNTVIASCLQGTQVYVRCTANGHRMAGDPLSPVSMFTGILLHSHNDL